MWLFRDGWRIRLQAEELHLHIREIKRSISHTYCSLLFAVWTVHFSALSDIIMWLAGFWWCQHLPRFEFHWLCASSRPTWHLPRWYPDAFTHSSPSSKCPYLPPGDAWMSRLIHLVGCSPCMTDVEINILDWVPLCSAKRRSRPMKARPPHSGVHWFFSLFCQTQTQSHKTVYLLFM